MQQTMIYINKERYRCEICGHGLFFIVGNHIYECCECKESYTDN